jgi:acyl-CoA thioesterase YciA
MSDKIRNLPKRTDPILRVIPGPSDINANGHIFGGWVLGVMDQAGGIVAGRVSQGACATVAIEKMEFIAPILLRDIISVYASLERRGGRQWVSASKSSQRVSVGNKRSR